MTESDELWPLLATGGPAPSPAAGGRCPVCTYPVTAWASFCEGCGAPLLPSEPPPAREPATAGSARTQRLGVTSSAPACPQCGGAISPDGYCLTCGAKAPNPRDHLESAPARWIAGACDRGVVHHRNEDAMALWAAPDRALAVLVVCDGVSSSDQADVASLAGAERACEVLAEALAFPSGPASGAPGSAPSDPASSDPGGLGPAAFDPGALSLAAAEANSAITAATSADSENAASATLAAAVVAGEEVHYANLGDSRVYWLSHTEQLLLTVDHSVAQEFIEQGMPRQDAESMPSAHAITKWLGRDSDSVVPRVGRYRPSAPGWLVVCSDGLWNYASEPAALDLQVKAAAAADDSPLEIARKLVVWANSQGGHDNVTVALARLGGGAPVSGSLTEGQQIEAESEHHDG